MKLYLAVFFLTYLIFVFVSGMLNPFVKPKSYMPGKSRWRFARSIALAFMFFSCLGLLAVELYPISRVVSFGLSGVGFGVACVILCAWRFGRKYRVHQRAKSFDAKGKHTVESSRAPRMPVSIERTPLGSSTLVPTADTQTADFIAVKTSEEQELELELATAHIAPDLTDFDQSIVEAEFQSVYGTDKLGSDFSSPDFSVKEVRVAGDHVAGVPERRTQGGSEASTYVQEILSEISKDTRNGLNNNDIHAADSIEKVEFLKQQAVQLREKNQQLESTKEALVGEVAELNIAVKKSQATARRNEAEKEHALLLKNKALQIAALERKKRRMTEVKARKVILKLRQNMELLEVDNVP